MFGNRRIRYPCMVLTTAILLGLCAETTADTRYALIAAHNLGDEDEEPLRYAEDDARRVYEVLTEIGGVSRRNAEIMIAPTAKTLESAFIALADRTNGDDPNDTRVVFVYFAGHGDKESIHLGREKYPRKRLAALTDRLDAEVKIAIVDACQTAARDRIMGARAGPGFDVHIRKTTSIKGTVTIQSSEVGEPAHESDRLGGALFTHYMLAALRGASDGNRDGQVTLLEAYQYAYHRTVKFSSAGSSVVQHPNFDIDLAGTEDLVMTRPASGSAELVLSSDNRALFRLFSEPSGVVIAELEVEPGAPVSLAVPLGRVLIQKRDSDGHRVAEVVLKHGEKYDVAPYEYEEISFEVLARRGGGIELRPNTLYVGFSPRGGRLGNMWIYRQGFGLGYARRFSQWRLFMDTSMGWSSYASNRFAFEETTLFIAAGIGRDIFLGGHLFGVTLGPLFTAYFQRRTRLDKARLDRLGIQAVTRTRHRVFAPGGVALLTWEMPFAKEIGLHTDGRFELLAVSMKNNDRTERRAMIEISALVGAYYRF